MPEGMNLGRAFAVIELDSSGLKTGVAAAKKSMTDGLKDIGKTTSSLGVSILGLTAPFIAFGAAAVASFSESQKVTTQLNAVLSSTGGIAGVTAQAAQNLASSLQNVTTYSDEAVLSGENILLTFTGIGATGGIFDAATKASLDMATALGMDLSSAAMTVGKALNSPLDGLTKLQRQGVVFTDAQKELVKSLVDMGDTAGAQKVILDELSREFGGSAVAAGTTFAGGLAILKNQLDGVMENIGGALIPVLQQMVTSLMPIINQVADWITKNPELIAQIAQVVIAGFALGTILTVVGTVISTVATIVGVLTGAFAFLLSPVGLLIIAITGIVYALSQLYPGGLKQLFIDAMVGAMALSGVLRIVLAPAFDWVKARVVEFLGTVQSAINTVQTLLNIINLVRTGQISIGDVAGAVANEITQNAGGGLGSQLGARAAGHADGGAVQAGMRYTVGERGAETFIAPANGAIVANNQGGGDGGMNIGTVVINASTEAGGRAAAKGFKEELESLYRGKGN